MKIFIRCSLAALLVSAILNISPAQWIQSSGPYGRDIAFFSVSGERIFALSFDSIFLSTNNGRSWTGISNGLSVGDYGFRSFAAVGPHLFVNTYGGVFFHSTNNGTSWTDFADSLSGAPIWDFAARDSILFAGTYGAGAFLSRDTGATWTPINSELTGFAHWTHIHRRQEPLCSK